MDEDESTDEAGPSSKMYDVGYGKTPKATRFGMRPQPVRTGRVTSDTQSPDIATLLNKPVEASIGGKKTKLHPHEAVLHGLFTRVAAGEVRAIKLFLDDCKRAELLDQPLELMGHGVIEVPNGVPPELAGRLVKCLGPPPWDPHIYDQFKAEFDRDRANLEQLKLKAKALYKGQGK